MVKRVKEFVLLFVFLIFSIVLITNFISAADCNGYLNCGAISVDMQCIYAYPGVCTWTGSSCVNAGGGSCSMITTQFSCGSVGCTWSGPIPPVCSSGVCCVGGQIGGSSNSCNSETRFICTGQEIQIQSRLQYCTGVSATSCGTTWDSWTNQGLYQDCATGGYTCTEGQTSSSPFGCSCAPSCSGKSCGDNGCGGSCGTCPAYPHSVMHCAEELVWNPQYMFKCIIESCTGNYGNCDHDILNSNGCETPLGSNTNCAYCGNTCGSGYSCQNYVCAPTCVPETDSLFCKNSLDYRCGVWTSYDNCGNLRTVDCQMWYCQSSNPCTVPYCDIYNHCLLIEGAGTCASDGNACTIDTCQSGSCLHPAIDCNDGDSCTTDSCSGGSCSHVAKNCDDGNSCTTDSCSGGSCSHTAIVCNDGNACTSDSCSGGSCSYSPLTGNSCTSDGNACTNDVCSSSGSCTHPAVDCDDGDSCTTDSCSGGSCSHTAKNCDDSKACTDDYCSGGTCYHDALTGDSCSSDGNECTEDVCNSAGNCAHNVLNGWSCSSDGKSCTDDYCSSSGTCTHPALTGDSCTDDGNDCTDDVCNSAGNCAHNAIVSCINNDGLCCGSCTYLNDNDCAQCSVNSDCNDGNACTSDSCSGGSCSHNAISGCCTSSNQCNDGNACTTDLCSSNTCSHPAIGGCCTSSGQCDDGNVCTTNNCASNSCSYPAISGCCTSANQCNGAGYCQGKTCSGNVCSYPSISTCTNGDSCCPGSCNILNDNDCGAICGDNDINQASEDCDGSDLNAQTCASRLGAGYTGTLSCSGTCHFITNSCSAPSQVMGNGAIEGSEECDDGDTQNGDGCSSTGQIENGWECTGEPSVCTPVSETHGNGIIEGSEECDDGNLVNGDGCDSNGNIESGYTCTGEPSDCTLTGSTPGNGIIEPGEECDDGNTNNGDGCSSTGQIEPGYTCNNEPSVCNPVSGVHGNGVIDGTEECDDGNLNNGDGCSSIGIIEDGYTCTGEPSACSVVHGDGIISGTEQCDDSNLANGDGCSSTGQTESGYTCISEPSVCNPNCILTSAYWEDTVTVAGNPVRLYIEGTNCNGQDISFVVMEKGSWLVGDTPASTNPSNIIYGSPNTYGVWTAEWIDGNSLPEYYFTATVAGGGSTITSSKTDEDMIQVYESLDVVCLDKRYCANYDIKSFCEADLCSIGGNDAPTTITCGITVDNLTGCTDHTDCGCNWNTAQGKCGSDWNTVSTCEGENLSIGTCTYTENSPDSCDINQEGYDGMLTRSLDAIWTWSTENPSHSDPLGKQTKCQTINDVISCPASAQVPFFGVYQVIIVIVIVIIIYLIYFLIKKDHLRHTKRHSRIVSKKRRK